MNLLESLRREMNEHGHGEDDILYCRCRVKRSGSRIFDIRVARVEPKAFLQAISSAEYDPESSSLASIWRFEPAVRVQMKDGSFIEWCIQSDYGKEGWEWHEAPNLNADEIEDVEPEMIVLR